MLSQLTLFLSNSVINIALNMLDFSHAFGAKIEKAKNI